MKHLFALAALAALLLTACGHRADYRRLEGGVWATTYHITYRSGVSLDDSVFAIMRQVEHSLSPFDSLSIISAVNRGDTTVRADSMLRHVFETSQEVNRLSHGMFDPTVGPLISLWGFGKERCDTVPPDSVIARALLSVGIAQCAITPDGRVVKKSPDTEFNFSAITKGFGCDMVGAMFERNGVTDYLVEIGGEIAAAGVSPRGTAWRVQVDAPEAAAQEGEVTHSGMSYVALSGGGLATSGNYRNFHDTRIGRVGHTISAVTGRPVQTDMLSASILAPTCMLADALATSCMAMGSAGALRMIEAMPGAEGLFAVARGDTLVIVTTAGWPAAR